MLSTAWTAKGEESRERGRIAVTDRNSIPVIVFKEGAITIEVIANDKIRTLFIRDSQRELGSSLQKLPVSFLEAV